MTSRFECFPMVLLEAMSHGVPAVAFACLTGPAFIINDKVDGLLIEQNDISAMAEAIMNLISNEEKRKAYGDAAYHNISRFSTEKVYVLWQGLFAERSSDRTRDTTGDAMKYSAGNKMIVGLRMLFMENCKRIRKSIK